MNLNCKSFYIQYYPYRVFFVQDMDNTDCFKCALIYNYVNAKDLWTFDKFCDTQKYTFQPLHIFLCYRVHRNMFEHEFNEYCPGLYKSDEGILLIEDEEELNNLIGDHFDEFL
jgi:hypothetical protein